MCLPGAVASAVSPATATTPAVAAASAAICNMKLVCQTFNLASEHSAAEHSWCHAWNTLRVQSIQQLRAGLAQTERTGTLQYQIHKVWLSSYSSHTDMSCE